MSFVMFSWSLFVVQEACAVYPPTLTSMFRILLAQVAAAGAAVMLHKVGLPEAVAWLLTILASIALWLTARTGASCRP